MQIFFVALLFLIGSIYSPVAEGNILNAGNRLVRFTKRGKPKIAQDTKKLQHHTRYISSNPQDAVLSKRIDLNAFEVCLCGAFATIVGDFVMHPIDTIKVTQQSSVAAVGFVGAIKQIFKAQGLLGFYQGVVPYLVGDGCSGAVKFAAFDVSKKYLERKLPRKYHGLAQFICAAGAMLACSVILVPGEVLKTKIQAGVASSLGSAIKDTLEQEGVRGLFAGYYATLVRDVPYTMLELGVYENIKSLMRTMNKSRTVLIQTPTAASALPTEVMNDDNDGGKMQQLSSREESLAAAITGAFASFLTTPLDLVKTKLMLQGVTAAQNRGVLGCFESIYKTGGVGALFVGSTARITWLVPFTTIYLGLYELSKRKLIEFKGQGTSYTDN